MSGELGKSGVLAVKWSAISTVARFGLQLVAQVILARLLGPANYGIFGIGMVVLTFSAFLSNFGFTWNLLHRPNLTEEDIRFAFTWQVMVGCVATIVLLIIAPWLAAYFREPRVEPVIRWLSLALLLSAATATSNNLLQRALNFRVVGLVQVVSYAIGYLCVGVPLALLGAGVNALVAAWLSQALAALVLSYGVQRHSLRPLFRYAGAPAAFGQGGTVFLTNIVNWWLNNLDRVILGRVLLVHDVGLYSAGYNLAIMPNSLLLGALQPSFMAAASRLQSEPERMKRAYLQMLATIWALALPAFVVMAVLSSALIRVLYGPQWSETGIILSILFLGMPAYVSWGLSTPVLWNTHRKHYEMMTQVPVLILGAAAFYLCARFGVRGFAAVASLLLFGRMFAVGWAAFGALGMRFGELAPYVMRGLGLSMAGGLAAWAGDLIGQQLHHPLLSLILGALFALVVLVGIVCQWPEAAGPLAVQMLLRFFPRLERIFLRRASYSKET